MRRPSQTVKRSPRMRTFNVLMWVLTLLACNKKAVLSPTATDCDVVVVGAGLAGLSAAYELQKAGMHVVVLEERAVIGGRVATATYGPNVIGEYGMQEIWEDSPLLALAQELRVPLDEPEPAFSSALIDGQVVAFTQPSGGAYLQALLGEQDAAALKAWMGQAQHLHERARTAALNDPQVQHLQDISFATWLAESHLPPRAVQWLRLTVESEMAAEAEIFSALSALLDMEMFFEEGLKNYHVRGGNSRIVEALARPLGERLQTGALVTAVHRSQLADGTYRLRVRYEKSHTVTELTARRVVLAIPSVRVHQTMMQPPLPADYWLALNSLRFGHYVVVHFLAPKASRNLVDVDTFPVLAGGPLGVVYGPDHNSEGAATDVFGLLIYGEPARLFHMAPRESRVADIRAGLQKVWPGYAATLGDASVYTYHPTALPVWPPGRSSIDKLAQTLRTPHLGLHLAGDYTQGAHATGAVVSGLETARTIVAELR